MSNMHDSGVRTFSHDLRTTFSTGQLGKFPGPGQYRL